MQSISLTLGAPVTVALAPPEISHWGPYQFPGLERLPDGRIRVSFQIGADSATAVGLPPMQAVSSDEGRSWTVLPLSKGCGGGSSKPLQDLCIRRVQNKGIPE
jgi:hypothetical protein